MKKSKFTAVCALAFGILSISQLSAVDKISADEFYSKICFKENLFYARDTLFSLGSTCSMSAANHGSSNINFGGISTNPASPTVLAPFTLMTGNIQFEVDPSLNIYQSSSQIWMESSGVYKTSQKKSMFGGNPISTVFYKDRVNISTGQRTCFDYHLGNVYEPMKIKARLYDQNRNQAYYGEIKRCDSSPNYQIRVQKDRKVLRNDITGGYFKIVNEKFTKKGDDEGLYTQVAGRDFKLKVVHFDASGNITPYNGFSPVKVDVLGESFISVAEGLDVLDESGMSLILKDYSSITAPFSQMAANEKKIPILLQFRGKSMMTLTFKNFNNTLSANSKAVMIDVHFMFNRTCGSGITYSNQECGTYGTAYATDSFAIRPSKLKVEVSRKPNLPRFIAGDRLLFATKPNTMENEWLSNYFSKLKIIPVDINGKQNLYVFFRGYG